MPLTARPVSAHAAQGRQPDDSVILTFEERLRQQGGARTVGGLDITLMPGEAPALRHGDFLALDDGRLVDVVAQAEPQMEVRGRDAAHLLELAWVLGNRHVEAQITAKWLRIRADATLAEMLTALGAKVVEIEGPFQPVGAAEQADHSHEHHHHGEGEHHHDHAHGHHHHHHGHEHGHDDHDHGHAHAHQHGESCGCKHHHDHHHPGDHDHAHDHGKPGHTHEH